MATTKQRVSDEQRRQVLDLRRKHSLREVAEATGLPLGTVKTIVSRSGAFRDNAQHRALFTLPPVREAAETLPAEAPELPPQEVVTGDRELDAVLWLRGVITTGNAAMIAKALEAAKRIKTPADTLEKRYAQYLATTTAHPLQAVFGSFGFADLEALAGKTIKQRALAAEAEARFGETLFINTAAEDFAFDTLASLNVSVIRYDESAAEVARRFRAYPSLMPNTLADCLHELDYWDCLYRLRMAVSRDFDDLPEITARRWFVEGLLGEIRPRSREEAKAVFRHLLDGGRGSQEVENAIIENLLG